VTPAGDLRDVTATSDPDLFWALRGGGGRFGVVTEMEIDLVPATELHGGGVYVPGESAPELMAAFGQVTATAPDGLSLSVAILTLPPAPAVPAPLRGRFVAHLRVTHLGGREETEALIAPLRAVAPAVVDTVRPLPIVEIGTVHADPAGPQPVSCGSAILPTWDPAAVAILLDEVGSRTPHMLELRHLGGALARPVDNAVGHRDAAYSVFTSAYPGPGFTAATAMQEALYGRLTPWSHGRSLLNFTAGSDASRCFDEPTRARLANLARHRDPSRLFRFAPDL